MKKPNKIERMNAYLYAWAILTGRIEQTHSQTTNCVCPMLQTYLSETTGFLFSFMEIIDAFPEFAKQKPKGKDDIGSWFSDNDKKSRITALENAIKLLA